MNLSGWVFLMISSLSITALMVFCFYKIFTKRKIS